MAAFLSGMSAPHCKAPDRRSRPTRSWNFHEETPRHHRPRPRPDLRLRPRPTAWRTSARPAYCASRPSTATRRSVSVDAKSKQIEGLDVDYAKALADKLGVRLQVLPTNPANRIPLLTANKVDLVLANLHHHPGACAAGGLQHPLLLLRPAVHRQERHPDLAGSPQQVAGRRGQGHGQRRRAAREVPGAKVIAYDDTPFAFTALRNGQVQAITQDGPKLIGLLANVPDRDKYEVPPLHHFQRPDRRRYSQGREGPDRVRRQEPARAGAGRPGAEDLRHLVRSADQDPLAPVQDRRQELSGPLRPHDPRASLR